MTFKIKFVDVLLVDMKPCCFMNQYMQKTLMLGKQKLKEIQPEFKKGSLFYKDCTVRGVIKIYQLF